MTGDPSTSSRGELVKPSGQAGWRVARWSLARISDTAFGNIIVVAANHRLIEIWRKCNLNSPPYYFPGDESKIARNDIVLYTSFEAFVQSRDSVSDTKRFHVGLIPIPYIGNLKKASIFALMLNPGLSPGDYYAEQKEVRYRRALVRNLRQENAEDDFPFIFLDPQFAWHPGFNYWHGKFENVISAIATQKGKSYREAMRYLSERVACLELIPYHSKPFGASALLSSLPSAQTMAEYARDVVAQKARRGDAVSIVARAGKIWGLVEGRHGKIVVYKGGEAHSAHLTLKSRGGRAIARHLGLKVE